MCIKRVKNSYRYSGDEAVKNSKILRGSIDDFIIRSFKSEDLREHLYANPPKWTDWQRACLIRQYMNPYDGKRMYLDLMMHTKDETFGKLLTLIVDSIEKTGSYESDEEEEFYCKSYADRIVHSSPDGLEGDLRECYFIDYVGLPVIFKAGDLIEYKAGRKCYRCVVEALPERRSPFSDYSDECYYAHWVTNEKLERVDFARKFWQGYFHEHIPVTDAYRIDVDKLSPKQLENYMRFKELIELGVSKYFIKKGVFWLRESENGYDENYFILNDCYMDGTLKGKSNYFEEEVSPNHERTWSGLPKALTEGNPYNYYPRGRVEINDHVAKIFINPDYCDEATVAFIKKICNLAEAEEKGCIEVKVIADGSAHYKYKRD